MRNVVNAPNANIPIATNATVPFPPVAGNVGFSLSEIVNACSTFAADISISTGSFSIWYPSGALVSVILYLPYSKFVNVVFPRSAVSADVVCVTAVKFVSTS